MTIAIRITAATFVLAGLPGAALSQSAAPSGAVNASHADVAASAPSKPAIEQVVVTAQRRSERVQRVPVAVTVVSGKTLASHNITQVEDLAKLVPGFSSTSSAGQIHGILSIRGIYTDTITPGVPSSVGVVVDDVPQPPEAHAWTQLSDIANVEILEGPQPTISGRNAAAGLLNILTTPPADHFSARLSLTQTSDRETRASAFVTGALSETLDGSISAFTNSWNGVIYNNQTGKNDGNASDGVRVKLQWRPSDALQVDGTIYYVQLAQDEGAPIFERTSPNASLLGFFPLTAALGFTPQENENTTVAPTVSPYQNSKEAGGNFRVRASVGDLTLMSITSYMRETIDQTQSVLGIANVPIPGWCDCQKAALDMSTVSQEFRLLSPPDQRLTYLAGLFYLDTPERYNFQRDVIAPFNADRQPYFRNYAAYARATLHITDQWELTGGVRYLYEQLGYNLQDHITNTTQSSSADDNALLGDVELAYHFRPDQMVYVRYARGFQGKAFDLDVTYNPAKPYVPVEPEEMNDFELGVKTQFLDHRATLNLALFDAIYNDYQAQAVIINGTEINNLLQNAGQAETRGIEASGTFLLTRGTNFNVSSAYLSPVFNSYKNAACYPEQTAAEGCTGGTQDLSGHRLANTPNWRVTASLEQKVELPTMPFDLAFRADGNWQSKVNFDVTGNPNTIQNDYGIANASVAILDHKGHYTITAFLNNIGNTHYFYDLNDAGGLFGNVPVVNTRVLPRDWSRYGGVRLDYAF